jgi:osmotically-inducible protein OsmY
MKIAKPSLFLFAVVMAGILVGCSTTSTTAAGTSDSIRSSLDKAGYKQAESIAKSFAGTEVVSNQIAILPVGAESDTRKVNADLDKGIEGNLDAALIQERLHEAVKYVVKNSVVTLSGNVDSQAARARAESVASAVPNVHQVVNELQVKSQKATSSS